MPQERRNLMLMEAVQLPARQEITANALQEACRTSSASSAGMRH
jgi:hypothetical protein